MSRAKLRRKTKTPREIAEELAQRRAAAFHAFGMQPEASRLPANDAVEVDRAARAEDGKRAHADRARRADAFDSLREGMQPGSYDSVRRLEKDMATRRGEGDKGRPMERVDNDMGGDRIDSQLAAGERVDAVLSRIGDRDRWLLSELIEPGPMTKINHQTWREIVQYVTGETHMHGQAAAVRSACANLHCAYEERPPKHNM